MNNSRPEPSKVRCGYVLKFQKSLSIFNEISLQLISPRIGRVVDGFKMVVLRPSLHDVEPRIWKKITHDRTMKKYERRRKVYDSFMHFKDLDGINSTASPFHELNSHNFWLLDCHSFSLGPIPSSYLQRNTMGRLFQRATRQPFCPVIRLCRYFHSQVFLLRNPTGIQIPISHNFVFHLPNMNLRIRKHE